jgi:hypothetical protein
LEVKRRLLLEKAAPVGEVAFDDGANGLVACRAF